jgi:Tfp pilus assembly protein PilO
MLNTLGRKGIAAIGAVVCIVVLVAGWFLLISPVKSDISKTKAEAATQVEANDSARLKLSSMRSIAKQLPREQAELAALTQKVPASAQLPTLLRDIQTAADNTGVSLKALTPSQPADLASAPGISAVQISMSVSGGYAEIEQFESALEGLKRTFLVSGFSMTGGSKVDSTGKSTPSDGSTDITTSIDGQVLLKSVPVATPTPAAASSTGS